MSIEPGRPDVPGSATVTGDADVDELLARLAALDVTAPPADLLPTLSQAHDALAARLRAVEE